MSQNGQPTRKGGHRRWSLRVLLAVASFSAASCTVETAPISSNSGCTASTALEGACAAQSAGLALNDIQVVGSHNSYKLPIPAVELFFIRLSSPEAAQSLDYGHTPLADQLDLGMRQIELDIFHDPEGGRYADPLLPRRTAWLPKQARVDREALKRPGFKVMHIQDIDTRSTCTLFVACLRQIKRWSQAHRDHAPILILLNAKDAPIDVDGAVTPLRFDAAAFDALDAEILSVFDRQHLITPDDVRGGAPTLREAVLKGGWPSLDAARGKVLFALDESQEKVAVYLRGRTSLQGLPMFVNSASETPDHAAYFTINDPIAEGDRIRGAVRAGFLVRTRADADTKEARAGDVARREAAFASGAHYVSTDYYRARRSFGDYVVALPGGASARCNPVRRGAACARGREQAP